MNEPHLDDYEKEVVRFLAEKCDDEWGEWDVVHMKEFPRFKEVGKDRVQTVTKGLLKRGLLTRRASLLEDGLYISCDVHDLVLLLANPPPADYWKSVITWFRSRWWSIPVLVIAVLLPLMVQWVEMIKTLLRWIGMIE